MTASVSAVSGWLPVGPLTPEVLTYSVALNAASGWSMTVPLDWDLYASLLASGAGVRIVDNGVPFFGLVKRLEARADGALVVSGVSALSMLADRVPVPEPANAAGPWPTSEAHVVTAPAVAAWVSLLSAHVAGGGVRDLPQSCRVDSSGTVAATVTLSARWSPDLLGVVEELATGTGVSVSADLAVANTSTELVFTVSALGSSTAAVFDPALGSVSDWRLLDEPERPTHVYVGGAGDGTARTVRLRSQDGPRRVERWVEGSSADTAELDAIGDAYLAEHASVRTLEVDITDGDLSYGDDYRLGDLVTIRIAGIGQVTDRVTKVDSTLTSSGFTRKVQIGSGALSLLGDNSARRLGRLEGA